MTPDKDRRVENEDNTIIATTRKNGEIVINSKAVITLIAAAVTALVGSGFSLGGKEELRKEFDAMRAQIISHAEKEARDRETTRLHLENLIGAVRQQTKEECILRVERIDATNAALLDRVRVIEEYQRNVKPSR